MKEAERKNEYEAICNIIRANKEGNVVAEFPSITEAAKQTSNDFALISRVCKGKGRTAGGYFWRFKSEFAQIIEGTVSQIPPSDRATFYLVPEVPKGHLQDGDELVWVQVLGVNLLGIDD